MTRAWSLPFRNQLLARAASSSPKPGGDGLPRPCRHLPRCAAASPGSALAAWSPIAAIEALTIIGGCDAAHAVSEMIERAVVQGPGLQVAVSAAANLGTVLSPGALCRLLRDAEPRIRADACRCARPLPQLISLLIDLLDDLDQRVATSAACALGRMGKIEARGRLKTLLRHDPSEDVIDAVTPNRRRGMRGVARADRSIRIGAGRCSACQSGEHRPCPCRCYHGCDPALATVKQ